MVPRERLGHRVRDGTDVLCALPVVLGIRILLWILPYAWWRRLFARALAGAPGRGVPVHDGARIARIGAAVSRASRIVPAASCLTQALAAQLLLARAGQAARLRLGVARASTGALHAHAWLETSQGMLDVSALGGTFAPLTVPDRSTPAHRAAAPHRRAAGEL